MHAKVFLDVLHYLGSIHHTRFQLLNVCQSVLDRNGNRVRCWGCSRAIFDSMLKRNFFVVTRSGRRDALGVERLAGSRRRVNRRELDACVEGKVSLS